MIESLPRKKIVPMSRILIKLGSVAQMALGFAVLCVVSGSNAAEPTDPADTRFDLSFKGGTASELVARVHRHLADQKVETALNIHVMPEQAATPIPPLTLHNITFRELAAFLKGFSKERATASVGAGRAAQVYGFEKSGGIWFFTVSTNDGVGRTKVSPVTARAAVYRVKAAPDLDVVGVLTQTLTSHGRAVPKAMVYQASSHALVMRGTEAEHQAVKQALRLMQPPTASVALDSVEQLKEEKRQLAARCEQLERDLLELKSQVRRLSGRE